MSLFNTVLLIAFVEKSPGPGKYSPKTDFNQEFCTVHTAPGFTKFGKDERKALEDKIYINPTNPGPGTY